MAVTQKDIDNLHGRLAALEALIVMALAYQGADALRAALEDVRARARVTPPEDAKELVALAAQLNGALASLEHDRDRD